MTRRARTGVATAAAALPLLALMIVAPAHAVTAGDFGDLGVQFDADGVGSTDHGCVFSGPDADGGVAFTVPDTAAVEHKTYAVHTSVVDPGDPTNDAAESATTSGTWSTKTTTGRSEFDMSAHGVVKAIGADPEKNACNPETRDIVEMTSEHVLDSPGWLLTTMTAKTDGVLYASGSFVGEDALMYPDYSTTTTTYLGAGTQPAGYEFDAYADADGTYDGADVRDLPNSSIVTFSVSVSEDYFDRGAAHGDASGGARGFVHLADEVSCASRTLGVRFSKAVRTARFSIGGKLVRTVQDVRAGRSLTLHTVRPRGRSTTVTARVERGRTVTTVRRTYYGCSQ